MDTLNLKNKILIIGDSLCLPRSKPEVVEFIETWPYLLNYNNKFEVMQLSIGGGTIKTLYEQSFYYLGFQPDFVVIQSGIVDCAPRALSWLEKEVINSSRALSLIFSRFMPTNLMRKYRNLTYTNACEYRRLIKEFSNQFPNAKVIFIGIVPASIEYEVSLPNISKNIKCYNEIIENEINIKKDTFLNVNEIPSKGIMSDYHHLNSIGHKWLSDKILSLIE